MNFSRLSSESTLGKIARIPLALLPGELILPILQGPLRGKQWISGSATHGCWLGSYEYEKQQVIAREVWPGAIFYDVGANVGFYSLLSSLLVGRGRVFAFEPAPRNLPYLRRHLELNHAGNVEVLPLAISDTIGQAQFQIEPSGLMGHLARGGSAEVSTVTLDSLVESGRIAPPNFVKMDIEGAELLALRGSSLVFRRFHPVLFLATHGASVETECRGLLRAWCYEVEEIGPRTSDRSELLARSKFPK
jgi:FkbM family methyltransferase